MDHHNFTIKGQGIWQVKIFTMKGWDFHVGRSRFYFEQLIFTMTGQDFHVGRSRFYFEQLRFPWWQVKILWWQVTIFVMTGWDFHDDRSKFCYEQLRFSWWQVKILKTTGPHFHDDRARLSWWQVEIFMMISDSRISAKFQSRRGAYHHLALIANFQIMQFHVFAPFIQWIIYCLSISGGMWGMRIVVKK